AKPADVCSLSCGDRDAVATDNEKEKDANYPLPWQRHLVVEPDVVGGKAGRIVEDQPHQHGDRRQCVYRLVSPALVLIRTHRPEASRDRTPLFYACRTLCRS